MPNILAIGKQLIRGDIDTAIKMTVGPGANATIPIDPARYRGNNMGGNGWAFSAGNGIYSYFQYADYNSCVKAYTECPSVNAVINKKAQAYINGKTWVLNSLGKEATGVKADKLRALLARPNLLQSWTQFEAQMYIFTQLFGYCPILMVKPLGYTDPLSTTSMWCIPPPYIAIEDTRKFVYQTSVEGIIKKITIRFRGEVIDVPLNDLCIIRDFTPDVNTPILPDSRIRALQLPINNSIGAYESRNVLINYRGALGIFSKETGGVAGIPNLPITDPEKEQLQQDFRRYGLRGNQWQFIVTSAAVKWQQVSVPTKDLLLFEEVESTTMAVCDGYNMPFELMASGKGVTFSNKLEAKKLLYQDAIIPEAESIYGQLNTYFRTKENNLKLDKDYSKVPVLQADQVAEMTARKTRDDAYKIEWDNDLITLNEWRMANGDDPLPNEMGGKRKSELLAEANAPLISVLGVSGTQALIEVITNPGMSQQSAQAVLEIVFRISPADAARMVAGKTTQSQTDNNGTGQQETQSAEAEAA